MDIRETVLFLEYTCQIIAYILFWNFLMSFFVKKEGLKRNLFYYLAIIILLVSSHEVITLVSLFGLIYLYLFNVIVKDFSEKKKMQMKIKT